jgi:hypothetical protein
MNTITIQMIVYGILIIPAILKLTLMLRNLMKRQAKEMVFISGKVTGLWRWWVVLKFKAAEIWFKTMGLKVWNPVRRIPKTATWEEAMEMSLQGLKQCDYVFFQFDWIWSEGARKEFEEATSAGKMLLNMNKRIQKLYEGVVLIKIRRNQVLHFNK